MKQEQKQRQASKAQFSVEIVYYHLTINVDTWWEWFRSAIIAFIYI